MTAFEVWWGRESMPGTPPPSGAGGGTPTLLPPGAAQLRAAVRDRIAGYTPDWTDPGAEDAGVALVRLFGSLAEPVVDRINRLPDKVRTEHLRVAGVRALPSLPAGVLLEFTVDAAADGPVTVPAGLQVSASGPGGDPVVFETDGSLQAAAVTVASLAVAEEDRITDLGAPPTAPFPPFGARPEPGAVLWVGFAGPAAPEGSLSVGFTAPEVTGGPAAVSAGAPSGRGPRLDWAVWDGDHAKGCEIVRDETDGLRHGGIVELRLPSSWRTGAPPGRRPLPALRWLRVRLLRGRYERVPLVASVGVNVGRATAVQTFRGEVPDRVTGPDGRTRIRLAHTPVRPGSVRIAVLDDSGADLFGTASRPRSAQWRETLSLATAGPEDRVFTVDEQSGEVTFGDGVNGRRPPDGFRTVEVTVYRAGGGSAGAVASGAVSTLVTAVPFLREVTNPRPASGGTDAEPVARATLRGAAELRTGGRAVAPSDYALRARHTPDADVARAHGVAGWDPDLPGRSLPGVVGVLVVPSRPAAGLPAQGPPLPAEELLRAVAEYVSRAAAPAGVRIVAAAPLFLTAGVEAAVVCARDLDSATVLSAVRESLDDYLHPVRGGEDGDGWPFGGALGHHALVHRVLSVPGVEAVPRLSVVLNGHRLDPGVDHPIPALALLWPGHHRLTPLTGRSTP
ncbi:putative baseplate assembly protein [Streptomyces canus]|uniref:putative baseplate assembly protein n=1 Tax=Streptomyces canus TaxID=58343 RepID=UPI0036803FD3